MMIRLNRYLSECGVASRRKSEEFIKEARVSVNGKIVIDLATKINPLTDKIALDGEVLRKERSVYYLLNKPKGTITSTKDEKNRKTVLDIINTNRQIFPVGRLDYNTTGVLFLTNDGEFTNFITHPRNKIPREYLVTLDKPLEVQHREQLVKGVYLDKKKSKFIKMEYPSEKTFQTVLVTCEEGRNHFVKRMFGLLGYHVDKLHRKKYAGIGVGNLQAGEYRKMTEEEINKIVKNFS